MPLLRVCKRRRTGEPLSSFDQRAPVPASIYPNMSLGLQTAFDEWGLNDHCASCRVVHIHVHIPVTCHGSIVGDLGEAVIDARITNERVSNVVLGHIRADSSSLTVEVTDAT